MIKFPVIERQVLDLSRPRVMGILNVTPDSFYDGGKYLSETKVIERIRQIVEEGADIIDVGACSTRSGAAGVDEKEEMARLEPAVELIRKYYPNMLVSIDTYRAKIAEEINTCLGPVIVNDISGGTMDSRMFETVARMKVPYILMHIQGIPRTMQRNPVYGNVVEEVKLFFKERITRLNDLGFDNLILDPGFGFGKTAEHNFQLMEALDTFQELGYPVLSGISRKGMIWKTLDITPAEALNGTTVLNTVSLMKGAQLLRVHDVKEAVEAVKLFNCIHQFARF